MGQKWEGVGTESELWTPVTSLTQPGAANKSPGCLLVFMETLPCVPAALWELED